MNIISRQELRSFGYLFGTMLILVFGIILPVSFGHRIGGSITLFGFFITPIWPWLAACGLWILSLICPQLLQPVFYIWMKIGSALGWINTRLIMLILFYAIILPIGLLMRLLGNDPMRVKKQTTTYRIASSHAEKNHLERPY